MQLTFFSKLVSKFFKKDKRRFPRIKAHCLLKYKSLDGREKLSFARNISASGILFYTREDLPVGRVVELKINFPPGPDSIKAIAKVSRSKVLSKMSGYGIAVEFINIDEKAKDFINNRISSINSVQKEMALVRK